ncbi:filamin A-interacting protein 1-like isoform X2 [Atheta coriaria]|uniref:filamin A-interacting protein 1-like isoform X2 n=1 Tax=Dalotia coriaria TaxID=877792 RepID=UPI0031F342D4
MSDTDDTDDLLLVPPDQYIANPETEVIQSLAHGTYFKIVDSLISQVNRLHTRVHSIEQIDLTSTSIDDTMDHHSNRYKSSDDILRDGYYNSSTFSTPQKPRMRYRASSQSPQKPKSCFTATKSNYSPRKLHEFNDYIHTTSNAIETNKKLDANSDIVEVNGRIINLAEIENMLEEIEVQKKKNDLRLREQEEVMQKSQAWRMGDDVKTLPPSCQMQNDNQVTENCNDFAKMTVTTLGVTTSGYGGDKSSTLSSTTTTTDSTQLTARHVMPTRQNNGEFENFNHTEEILKSRRLLSLNELWGQNEQVGSLTERLEEEKLRRQHCEDLIQDLQTRSLELQERLAVAVQVDKAKDNALSKFHDSWEKVTSRLRTLMLENRTLEEKIQELHLKNEQNMQECSMKIKQYEAEASKALNLAHGSHDKLSSYMVQNTELQEKLECLEKKILEVEESHNAEIQKSKKLNDIIVQKELDLTESRNVLNDSRLEVANSKKAIELCQVEFANMKTQYNSLEEILTEKQKTIKDLESKIHGLETDNDNLKVLHADAQREVLVCKEKMDKTKSDLRDFYQQQVELLVQDKLKEFQSQLDRAETSLQDEINKRELSIAKTAATHIQQITDKHNLEVQLLEEKQKEEIKYYQMQLQQAQQQITTQESKLKHFNERRTALAHQLHKVMEVQWMEALKIINNTKSPYNSTPIDTTLDQLKSLKVKSHNNLEEVLSDPGEYSAELERDNFHALSETPVSSKVQMNKIQKESRDNGNELQKYVSLLLNKQSTSTQMEPMKESSQPTQKRNRR